MGHITTQEDEEELNPRSDKVARSLCRASLPRRGVGQLGKVRKEHVRSWSSSTQGRGPVVSGL